MAMRGVQPKGLRRVLRNLTRERAKVVRGTRQGAIRAGFFLKRESQEKFVPVQFGNLRASAFVVWGPGAGQSNSQPAFSSGDGAADQARLSKEHPEVIASVGSENKPRQIRVMVGFTAHYALYVHEMERGTVEKGTGEKGTTWNVGEPKFLEKPLEQNHQRILMIVADEVKL